MPSSQGTPSTPRSWPAAPRAPTTTPRSRACLARPACCGRRPAAAASRPPWRCWARTLSAACRSQAQPLGPLRLCAPRRRSGGRPAASQQTRLGVKRGRRRQFDARQAWPRIQERRQRGARWLFDHRSPRSNLLAIDVVMLKQHYKIWSDCPHWGVYIVNVKSVCTCVNPALQVPNRGATT
ncbi:MAG: hypothetical protein J3K34DRAFT_196323 [Monoraphidium minutum]|nr:MAG: hypothetical protein J3K34DRAFT_196323 [Monoraphidium minutum]